MSSNLTEVKLTVLFVSPTCLLRMALLRLRYMTSPSVANILPMVSHTQYVYVSPCVCPQLANDSRGAIFQRYLSGLRTLLCRRLLKHPEVTTDVSQILLNMSNFHRSNGPKTRRAFFTKCVCFLVWLPRPFVIMEKRYPTPKEAKDGIETAGDVDAMVYYHRLGTQQCKLVMVYLEKNWPLHLADDVLIHSDKTNPEWMWGVDITDDGKYIILYTSKDSSRVGLFWNRVFILPDMLYFCRGICYGLLTLMRMKSDQTSGGIKLSTILKASIGCMS